MTKTNQCNFIFNFRAAFSKLNDKLKVVVQKGWREKEQW
jgi:hypothetical protein